MPIAILKTDSVLPQFKNQYGEYPQMLERLVRTLRDDLEFKTYDVVAGEYPQDDSEFDGFFIMGSKASVYDSESWIKQLGEYIQKLHAGKRKIIGICFGHQLLAHVLGGRTEKSEKGWGVGVHASRVINPQAWMQSGGLEFNLLVSHQDQVAELPDQAVHIASNEFCQYSMFSIANHVLGMQGHPEFSAAYALELMNFRQHKIGTETFRDGVNSLSQPTHESVITQWMIRFLEV